MSFDYFLIRFSKCVHLFYSNLDIIFYDGECHSSCHLCKLYHVFSSVLATGWAFILLKHLIKTADGWAVRVWDSVLTSA